MRRAPVRGFTYLSLIVLLMIMGLVAAAALKMGSLMQRAAAEEELLEIGAQFSEALRSYAAATPEGQLKQPRTLQDLLKDPRFPNPRRHLRKIFVDPVTGKAEWGIVWLGDKVGVLGVYSLSNRRPLKVANFDIRFQNMDNRERISDWKFMIAGGDGAPPVITPPNSPVGTSLFEQPAVPGSAALPGASAAPPAPPPPEPQSGAPARETVEAGDLDAAEQERAAAEKNEAERQQAEEEQRLRAAADAAEAASAASIDSTVPPPPRKR
ncbi:MAG TPA: type II secretion system protein [Burkholderiaceae bacterium]|nr:type II secretion system protein [Burkholderiaceae bacterium]